jgi:hypothetical protein
VEKLKKADFFLLVYTDATHDWSWCLYEAVLFDELDRTQDADSRKFYCVHYPGSPPPDILQRLQTIAATNDDIKVWLANFYQATKQANAFESLEVGAASKVEELFRRSRPRKYSTSDLRPSIKIYPAWLEGGQSPNWYQIPKNLPLRLSDVEIDSSSAAKLGFNRKPGRINIIEFLKRLDTEASAGDPIWINQFLEFLQKELDNDITHQNVIFFRSYTGRVLRPIIESITRSDDGIECTCKVVFADAFSSPL